jgi:hypothetical protein
MRAPRQAFLRRSYYDLITEIEHAYAVRYGHDQGHDVVDDNDGQPLLLDLDRNDTTALALPRTRSRAGVMAIEALCYSVTISGVTV